MQGQGVQLARGSRFCCWQLTCEPGNSCTGTGQGHLSGCWWHETSGPADLLFCSRVLWLLYSPFWGYLLFFTSLWWGDLCGTPKGITTFSSTAVDPCNSPSAIPNLSLILDIPLHAQSHQEKHSHSFYSCVTGLRGFQALETHPACTDISTGHLPLPGKPAQKTGYTYGKLLLGWNCEELTGFLMGLSL